jgi:RNA polymerase sigma-70 factor (ECF subfamily)
VNPSSEADVAQREPVGIDAEDRRVLAFRRLADEHLDAAYRLARAILRDPNDAQDATHDAFVQAWRKWSTLRDLDRFEPWFDRILVNTCRDRLRRRTRMRATDISVEVALGSNDPAAHLVERDAIGAAIATLSPEHRIVVALRYYRDLGIDEIASRLGLPPGTVHSRLHTARARLHAALGTTDLTGPPR